MTGRKTCLVNAHLTEAAVDGLCPICRGERLVFKGEDPGIDDLMHDDPKTVCWLAYYSDFSGMSVFFNEIDALRCAVDSSMSVIELKEGDVMDQITAKRCA